MRRFVDGRAGVGRDGLFEEPRPSGRCCGAVPPGGAARRWGAVCCRTSISLDGTLIEAWASMKSFRPRDGGGGDAPPGRNAERDFRGERRSNATHASTTDRDARLYRKARGQSSRLCYMGPVDGEQRADRRCRADPGFRHRRAGGGAGHAGAAEKAAADHARRRQGYEMRCARAPSPRRLTAMSGRPASRAGRIDRRTTRHPGYAASQKLRAHRGGALDQDHRRAAKTRHRGLDAGCSR